MKKSKEIDFLLKVVRKEHNEFIGIICPLESILLQSGRNEKCITTH
jgi:hypothetical protein